MKFTELANSSIIAGAAMQGKTEGYSPAALGINHSYNLSHDVKSARDWLQAGLAVSGCTPGLGTVTGIIDTGIFYANKGDYAMAGFSLVAAIPIAGEAVSIVKLRAKAKTLAKIGKVVEVAAERANTI